MIRTVPSKHTTGLKITILSFLVAGLLSGCGIRGSLKTPPPIFGGDSQVNPDRVPNEDLDTEQSDDDDDFDLLDQDPVADL